MSAEEPMSIADTSAQPSSNKRPKKDGDDPVTSDPEKSPESLESGVPAEDSKSDEDLEDADYEVESGSEYDFEMPSDMDEEEEMNPTPMERIKSYDASSQTKPSVSGFDKLCMAKKRLIRDFMAMKKESLAQGSASPDANDVLKWKGWLFGPNDSPFEDGSFFIKLLFTEEYPFDPPQVWFKSKMFHPNVFADGEISTRALLQRWSPASNVADLLRYIHQLLSEPYQGYIVNSAAWKLYLEDRQTYNSRVRACVKVSLDQDVDDAMAVDAEIADTEDKEPEPEKGEFEMLDKAPSYHKYKDTKSAAAVPKNVTDHIRKKDLPLLVNSLPAGIYVKGFEDRIDLFSVMMRGPEKTPYQDFLFFFDVQLPTSYPGGPPHVYFHPPRESGKTVKEGGFRQRINPNLYDCGKVCLSLLGTWSGPGWEPGRSTLLQVLVSIQGLILVEEPFYNEPGFKPGMHYAASREYSEKVVLRLARCLPTTINDPPAIFTREVEEHFRLRKARLLDLLEGWLEMSEKTWIAKREQQADTASKNVKTVVEFQSTQQAGKKAVKDALKTSKASYSGLANALAKASSKLEELEKVQVSSEAKPDAAKMAKDLAKMLEAQKSKLTQMKANHLQVQKAMMKKLSKTSPYKTLAPPPPPLQPPAAHSSGTQPKQPANPQAPPPPAHGGKKAAGGHSAQPGFAAAAAAATAAAKAAHSAGSAAPAASSAAVAAAPMLAAMLAAGPSYGASSMYYATGHPSLPQQAASLPPGGSQQGPSQPSTSGGAVMGSYGGQMMDLNEAGFDDEDGFNYMMYDDDDDDDGDDFYHFHALPSTDEQVLVGVTNQPPPSQEAGQAAYMQYAADAVDRFGNFEPSPAKPPKKDEFKGKEVKKALSHANKTLTKASQIALAAGHVNPQCKDTATKVRMPAEHTLYVLREFEYTVVNRMGDEDSLTQEQQAQFKKILAATDKVKGQAAPLNSQHLAAFKLALQQQGAAAAAGPGSGSAVAAAATAPAVSGSSATTSGGKASGGGASAAPKPTPGGQPVPPIPAGMKLLVLSPVLPQAFVGAVPWSSGPSSGAGPTQGAAGASGGTYGGSTSSQAGGKTSTVAGKIASPASTYWVYAKKPRTVAGPTDDMKEAAKKAAEQTNRPQPPFPLIPFEERSCAILKAAIDRFRELLEKNDFNSAPSPKK